MNLGEHAKDKVSGLEGTITGLCQFLTGSDRVEITTAATDGKFDSQWFDVERVVSVQQ